MFGFIKKIYYLIINIGEKYLVNLLLLFSRYWIGKIFLLSGLNKYHSWTTTLALFDEYYKVPHIPSNIAAILATFNEITFSCFLIAGLCTRLATFPLLGLTFVISIVFPDDMENLYWYVMLLFILAIGPGKLSLDHLIKIKFFKGNDTMA